MDPSELHEHLTALSTNIDTLEAALNPLLTTPLTTMSAPLPLLAKAKISALSAYAIESLLFGSIRLSGTDARSHPVFAELARTKGCFERIARAEDPNRGKPTMRVDKDAARRFVKAGLAGNEALQRQQVHMSLQQRHNQQLQDRGLKRKAEEVVEDEDASEDEEDEDEETIEASTESTQKLSRSQQKKQDTTSSGTPGKNQEKPRWSKKEKHKAKKAAKKAAMQAGEIVEKGQSTNGKLLTLVSL
jgi:exosome complex protein LRP1